MNPEGIVPVAKQAIIGNLYLVLSTYNKYVVP